MNRRNFLKLTSICCATVPAVSSTGCTHKKFYNPDQDIIIGGGHFINDDEIQNVLAVTNLHQREKLLVDTDFLPHGIYIDPNDKKRLITFEKGGTGAAVIDLNSHQVTTSFTAESPNIFSGHGAFDGTGKILYSLETNTETSDGKIIIRDSKSLQIIDELNTYGKRPHECKYIDEKNLIVVTNCGDNSSQASITYIDLQNNQLVDEIKIDGGNFNSCHFAISDNNTLIVSSAPATGHENGDIWLTGQQHKFTPMTEPKVLIEKLIGEALSICIDERHSIAAITHPEANLLTFWSLTDSKLLKAMSVPNPRGIALALDKKHYIVSYGSNTSYILISTKELTADKGSIMQPVYASGEHIINWSKTLTEIMPTQIYT